MIADNNKAGYNTVSEESEPSLLIPIILIGFTDLLNKYVHSKYYVAVPYAKW